MKFKTDIWKKKIENRFFFREFQPMTSAPNDSLKKIVSIIRSNNF